MGVTNQNIVFFVKNATASGSSHGSLQSNSGTSVANTTAPLAALTTTGWTVAKITASNFSTMLYNTTQASGTFSATDPQATASLTTNNSWRSEGLLRGNFAAGTWAGNIIVRCSTASSQAGRFRIRFFKSPVPTGAVNAVDIYGSEITSSTVTFAATGTSYSSTFSISMPQTKFYNEYLFMAMAWEITTQGGNNNADSLFYTGSGANVTTSLFTTFDKHAIVL